MFLALLLFPSVTGLFALGMAAIAAPIPKWRAMLDREIKWPFQVLIASGVVVMSLLFLPTAEWTALVFNSATDAAVPAESPAVTAMAETENVTETLAAARTESPVPTATAAAITETATSPTSEPLPTPTAAPTATPTATTEPTAAATPEATVEETPEPTGGGRGESALCFMVGNGSSQRKREGNHSGQTRYGIQHYGVLQFGRINIQGFETEGIG